MEGSFDTPNGCQFTRWPSERVDTDSFPVAMTMSQYLGRGATSRGRMTITPNLGTIVSDVPYLKDPNDKAAVIQGIVNVQNALKNVQGLTWQYPSADTTAADYVNNVSPQTPRGCSHIAES